MKIIAAITQSKGSAFEIAAVELEDPHDDEILIAIGAVELYHIDIVARDQTLAAPLPAMFGHEGHQLWLKPVPLSKR